MSYRHPSLVEALARDLAINALVITAEALLALARRVARW